ncbi:MAG TPA: hypothetical protein VFX96_16055 [Pyrinomonadaceae bacterium]|nr:hypothetical protein [Pyrinomonadaceae bacterium]
MSENNSRPDREPQGRTQVCPCCGARGRRGEHEACASCGALRVGPPLPRPALELPSYGASLASILGGALLVSVFLATFVVALAGRETFSLAPSVLLASAEQAAWRLRWTLLPASLIASLVTARALSRMRREPQSFTGLGAARAGVVASVAVAVAVAALVLVTVPERLRRRELARRAADNAVLYAVDRALHEYRVTFGSYPATPSDLRRLPRTDCSIEEVVARLEAGSYEPRVEVASLDAARGRKGRNARARRARSTDDVSGAGLTLTNYELVLPGRDRLLGTADDLRIRDGLILDSAPPPVETKRTPPNKI